MNRFLEFLYNSDSDDPRELRRDLEEAGVDVKKIEDGVSSILARARMAQQRASWIERARVRQAEFESKAREQSRRINERFGNTRELVRAALAGDLGAKYQERALVFFRNRDTKDLSDEDIQSFLADCEILDSL